MKVRFWGTRGSIPRPGDKTLRYGGNTTCVEVQTTAGTSLVIDCGSGAVDLGAALCRDKRASRGALLLTHTHWDHIQGFPFFAPFFVPGAEWDIYAPRGLSASLRQTLAGQMQHAYFPITLEAFAAHIRFHELVEGSFEHDGVCIRTQYLDHPALTLGYRIEADGVSVVQACDHEPTSRLARPGPAELEGAERRHVSFLENADLVIHDAQFSAAEYPSRIGWGHATPDYAAAVCRAAGVRRLALTHHDPGRSDDAVDAVVAALRQGPAAAGDALEVFAAAEGMTIDLGEVAGRPAAGVTAATMQSATVSVRPAIARHRIVLCALDAETEKVVRAAVNAEDISVEAAEAQALGDALRDRWCTVVIGDALGASLAGEITRILAEAAPEESGRLIIVGLDVAGNFEAIPGAEQLVWPFSMDYARVRIRAAIMRTECRWQRAALPSFEEERLRDLHALKILDSEPEERFDRIARLAAGSLQAPMALITLIDAERQWFKSCVGLQHRQTSREAAFCAHAILDPEPTVVPDTHLDLRFADNPAVTGGKGVRFYAGAPIRSPGGQPLGTLCVIDVRPRELDAEQLGMLKDFAGLVEEQLALPQPTS